MILFTAILRLLYYVFVSEYACSHTYDQHIHQFFNLYSIFLSDGYRYYAWDYRFLRTFSKHYSTGDPIPENLVKSLRGAKNMFAATELQRQVGCPSTKLIHNGCNRAIYTKNINFDIIIVFSRSSMRWLIKHFIHSCHHRIKIQFL